MPGLYSVPTRGPGTLITSLVYNGDHQAHVTGRSAAEMQSFGATATQLLVATSPFAVAGGESLPRSLGDELARLRFVIAAMKSAMQGDDSTFTDAAPPTTPWTSPLTFVGFAPIGVRVQGAAQVIANNTLTALTFVGATPEFTHGGVWEGVTHPTRFTAPLTGKYYVTASVTWAAGIGHREIVLKVNGSAFNKPRVIEAVPSTASAGLRQTIEAIVALTATDYVEFTVRQITGGNLSVTLDDQQSPIGAAIFLGRVP